MWTPSDLSLKKAVPALAVREQKLLISRLHWMKVFHHQISDSTAFNGSCLILCNGGKGKGGVHSESTKPHPSEGEESKISISFHAAQRR